MQLQYWKGCIRHYYKLVASNRFFRDLKISWALPETFLLEEL